MKLSEDITLGQLREIKNLISEESTTSHPYIIGEKYFIRTVTHHHTGILRDVYQHELVLTNAAWIVDDGNFTEAVKSASFIEVEMFPANAFVIVGRGSIIDAVIINSIPTSRK